MSNADSIAELLQHLRTRQSFVVTSHARPDGDAIGSSVALMHLLHALGKQAVVAFADPVPDVYLCLPGVASILTTLPETAPDALIFLECDSLERTGFPRAQFDRMAAATTLNIDHHLSGRPFATFNWIDPTACAVGAMVYDLARASGLPISPAMASCLYAAVLTDTGSFTYSSTNATTFALAEHLLHSGADANAIAQAIYFSHPASKLRLLGTALNNLQLSSPTGPIAWSSITLAEMQRAGASVEDSEGVVNYLIAIAGVRAAVLFREFAPSADRQFRLSLRSKGSLDVARIAESFGGGGHRNASGCTLTGDIASVISRVVEALQAACLATPSAPPGIAPIDPAQPATLLA
jgi:phosphoesterase RecJ-like protein